MKKGNIIFSKIGVLIKEFKENEFGKTLLDFKNYFTAQMATKALSFISIPVLTRLLSPDDYGIINVYTSYISIFIIVFSLNTFSSLSRYFYEEKDDYKSFFGSSIILSFSTLLLFFLVAVSFKDEFISSMDLPESLFYLIFLSVFLRIMDSFFQQNFIPLKKSKKIATVSVIKAYIGFAITIVIIVSLDSALYLGPIIGNILIGSIFAIYFIFQLKAYIKLSLKISHIKYILNYSVPLIPYALGAIILAQFDRIMINYYDGNAEAGLYSFAYNVGMLLVIFIGAMFQSWVPDFFKYMNAGNYLKRNQDINKMFRLILLAAVFLIYFGQEIAMLLADKSFHSAVSVIPLVVIGYIFFAIFNIFGVYPGYAHKTYYSSLILILSGITNIYLNILLIPLYGYIAAAYTTIASYIVMAILSWLISKFFLKVNIPPIRILFFPLLYLFIFVIIFYLLASLEINLWMGILVKGFFLFIFFFILFYKQINTLIKL